MTMAIQDPGLFGRFEEMAAAFREEVEVMVAKEKQTSRESQATLERKFELVDTEMRGREIEARAMYDTLRDHARARLPLEDFSRVFIKDSADDWPLVAKRLPDEDTPEEAPQEAPEEEGGASLAQSCWSSFRDAFEKFLAVSPGVAENAELLTAKDEEIRRLKAEVDDRDARLASQREELGTALVLKAQEERDLCEFKALREKESLLQEARLRITELQMDLEDHESQRRLLAARTEKAEAVQRERSERAAALVRRLEEMTEQVRLLSDENNTLRLELGRDTEYLRIIQPPQNPLSYISAAGNLSEELSLEAARFREELRLQMLRFPGLPVGGANCTDWCELEIERLEILHSSFLHRFQDQRRCFPENAEMNFVSRVQETDEECARTEGRLREADSEFQAEERLFNKAAEEQRTKLTQERDTKVKQLLDQAERSQSKAEKQLLLHQAKLFGQRVDTQISKAWDEQQKERADRLADHQRMKSEVRQKLKEEALATQQRTDQSMSASERFSDMARVRLGAVEEAWERGNEKLHGQGGSAVSHLARPGHQTYEDCVREVRGSLPQRPLPEGAQFAGTSVVADELLAVIRTRADKRLELRKDLEQQSLQQLRVCAEKFTQREAFQRAKHGGGASSEAEEESLQASQAAAITALLQMRQHRQVTTTLRQQFADFLTVVKCCAAAAPRLLPPVTLVDLGGVPTAAAMDLPPLPPLLQQARHDQEHRRPIYQDESTRGVVSTQAEPPQQETTRSSAYSPTPSSGENEQTRGDEPGMLGEEEGRFLLRQISLQLLERTLTRLNELHREELLVLKQHHVAEVRMALVHLCQMEPDEVRKAIEQDANCYEVQVRSRLTAEAESRICEDRRTAVDSIAKEVGSLVRQYREELDEAEQMALSERRRTISERLVVLQSQGAVQPGDRALMHRLRQELRCCDRKVEMHNNEFVKKKNSNSVLDSCSTAPSTTSAPRACSDAAFTCGRTAAMHKSCVNSSTSISPSHVESLVSTSPGESGAGVSASGVQTSKTRNPLLSTTAITSSPRQAVGLGDAMECRWSAGSGVFPPGASGDATSIIGVGLESSAAQQNSLPSGIPPEGATPPGPPPGTRGPREKSSYRDCGEALPVPSVSCSAAVEFVEPSSLRRPSGGGKPANLPRPAEVEVGEFGPPGTTEQCAADSGSPEDSDHSPPSIGRRLGAPLPQFGQPYPTATSPEFGGWECAYDQNPLDLSPTEHPPIYDWPFFENNMASSSRSTEQSRAPPQSATDVVACRGATGGQDKRAVVSPCITSAGDHGVSQLDSIEGVLEEWQELLTERPGPDGGYPTSSSLKQFPTSLRSITAPASGTTEQRRAVPACRQGAPECRDGSSSPEEHVLPPLCSADPCLLGDIPVDVRLEFSTRNKSGAFAASPSGHNGGSQIVPPSASARRTTPIGADTWRTADQEGESVQLYGQGNSAAFPPGVDFGAPRNRMPRWAGGGGIGGGQSRPHPERPYRLPALGAS